MRDREIGNGKNRPGQPFADQLPLQPGRRVAFKVPPGGGEGEAEEEGWILATIKKCLGDRLKYEVLDADDEKTWVSHPARSTFADHIQVIHYNPQIHHPPPRPFNTKPPLFSSLST
jgi:hypothetical protein